MQILVGVGVWTTVVGVVGFYVVGGGELVGKYLMGKEGNAKGMDGEGGGTRTRSAVCCDVEAQAAAEMGVPVLVKNGRGGKYSDDLGEENFGVGDDELFFEGGDNLKDDKWTKVDLVESARPYFLHEAHQNLKSLETRKKSAGLNFCELHTNFEDLY
ncbi:hypothetical protein T439DRAFT_105456 [Meredithblackwellia eburnea MCA 4105]